MLDTPPDPPDSLENPDCDHPDFDINSYIAACIQRREQAEQMAKEITTLAGHLNALNFSFIKLLSEFDEINGWCGDGIMSFAHWLNWKCGIGSVAPVAPCQAHRKKRKMKL